MYYFEKECGLSSQSGHGRETSRNWEGLHERANRSQLDDVAWQRWQAPPSAPSSASAPSASRTARASARSLMACPRG
eukprot:6183778-Pleurochrysis_carterae.AAC.3